MRNCQMKRLFKNWKKIRKRSSWMMFYQSLTLMKKRNMMINLTKMFHETLQKIIWKEDHLLRKKKNKQKVKRKGKRENKKKEKRLRKNNVLRNRNNKLSSSSMKWILMNQRNLKVSSKNRKHLNPLQSAKFGMMKRNRYLKKKKVTQWRQSKKLFQVSHRALKRSTLSYSLLLRKA